MNNGNNGNNGKKKKKNDWFFADLSINICQQVWDMGQAYYRKLQDPKTRPRRLSKQPVQLIKYFYFLFLTGSRLMEGIIEPRPIIQVLDEAGFTIIKITKVNEKHFRSDGSREVITSTMPILDEYEQKMWNFITDGGLLSNPEDIFKWSNWESLENSQISEMITNNFKIDLKEPETNKVFKGIGIVPHILRHMRAYNLMVNHKIPKDLIIKWLGWDNDDMLYYYVHLESMLGEAEQRKILRENNLLTNLKIDGAKKLYGTG